MYFSSAVVYLQKITDIAEDKLMSLVMWDVRQLFDLMLLIDCVVFIICLTRLGHFNN